MFFFNFFPHTMQKLSFSDISVFPQFKHFTLLIPFLPESRSRSLPDQCDLRICVLQYADHDSFSTSQLPAGTVSQVALLHSLFSIPFLLFFACGIICLQDVAASEYISKEGINLEYEIRKKAQIYIDNFNNCNWNCRLFFVGIFVFPTVSLFNRPYYFNARKNILILWQMVRIQYFICQ